MKVALAPADGTPTLASFLTTFGLGTVTLRLRSLNRPLRIIGARGPALRVHRRVIRRSTRKIGVSRSYPDCHLSEIRIHRDGAVGNIPVQGLQDGERVVSAILAMFEQMNWAQAPERSAKADLVTALEGIAAPAPATMPAAHRSASLTRAQHGKKRSGKPLARTSRAPAEIWGRT